MANKTAEIMNPSRPYQPLLLRILHGLSAAIAILSIITSFWVYNTYDGRFIQFPLPKINDIIGIHGTFGLTFLLFFPVLAIYSFYWGQKRLLQTNSLTKLTQVSKPVWWYSLHRIVNTLMLFAATWALITGRQMKEEWLPAGELNHLWYQLHLSAWVLLFVCLLIHILMAIKVGGSPLIISMFRWQHPPEESPRLWWQKLRSLRLRLIPPQNKLLLITEILVIGGILVALISPLFSSSPEQTTGQLQQNIPVLPQRFP
jgi:hypothetical protein